MPITFPISPSIGQIYTLPTGESWEWNGSAWQTLGSPGATGPIGPQGPTGATGPAGADALNYERRSSYTYPYHYSGSAPIGTSESSTSWTIKRINFTTPGSPVTQSATGAWTNRTSLIYS